MIDARPLSDFDVPDLERLTDAAKTIFGSQNCWIIRVPARLCLAADHTDYWGVFSPMLMTFASDSCAMRAVISPRTDSMIRMFNMGEFEDCEFDMGVESPPLVTDECQWLDWVEARGTPTAHWSNYVRGSVYHAQMHYGVKNGFDILIDSDIPPSSGASSSSALAICASIAIRLANELPIGQDVLTMETADAEWYVGTRGGMMDHATMVFAEVGKMLRLTFRPFSAQTLHSSTQLDSYKFVTVFTHPSNKGTSTQLAFNARALAAREVIPDMLAGVGYFPGDSLADVPFQRLPETMNITDISDKLLMRYPALRAEGNRELQVKDWLAFAIGEYYRSNKIELLMRTNGDASTLGSYMDQAWIDAGKLYGIRTPQMDLIADLCRGCDGVVGLKVMGAGFGGNLLALVQEGAVDTLKGTLQANSELFSRPIDESVLVHGPGQGVSILTGPEGDMNWALLWAAKGV